MADLSERCVARWTDDDPLLSDVESDWFLQTSFETRKTCKSFSVNRPMKRPPAPASNGSTGVVSASRRRWSIDRSLGLTPSSVALARCLNRIRLKRLLGKGGFGSVYIGVTLGRIVAVKKFHRNIKHERLTDSFLAECSALHLEHPNIVQVLATSASSSERGEAGSDHVGGPFDRQVLQKIKHPIIVMEYAGQRNLLTVINDYREKIDFKRRLR